MQQVRQSVFETNSSSSHSISIDSSGNYISFNAVEIVLTGGNFGWEQDTYYDFYTKANYAFQDLVSTYPTPHIVDQEKLDMLIKVISEFTGAKVTYDLEEAGKGNIDHQSSGTSYDAFASERTLIDFLFNPASYIETDNDNH